MEIEIIKLYIQEKISVKGNILGVVAPLKFYSVLLYEFPLIVAEKIMARSIFLMSVYIFY